MARRSKVEILLSAEAKGFNATVNKATRGWAAFNQEMGRSVKQVAGVKTQLAGLAGAFAGFQALSEVNQLLQDASTAAFGLEASITAANRQFAVGSMAQWQERLAGLNQELRIYSDTELQQATARTIDMTKRLGLNADQMEVVIRRTADLSAGRTDLVGGIERVTAALRGEAEASEYLGLTLNENYVKAWYNAGEATKGAWKDLDDIQKAQIRYQLFLEQADVFAGRAADSVTTYAGALQLVRKEITDGIGQHEDLTESLKSVATVLRDNADELGQFAATIAAGAAAVIEFAANNRELLITIAKWGTLFVVANKALTLVLGSISAVNAATVIMTGSRLIPWIQSIGLAALSAVPGVTSLSAAMGAIGLAGAGLFAGYKASEWVTMRSELAGISQAAGELDRNTSALAVRFKEISNATGVAVSSMADLDRAIAEGNLHFDDATGTWKRGAAEMAAAVEQSAAGQIAATQSATDEMKKAYQGYVAEVKRLQDQIAGREQSLAEQLRAMARTGMDDVSAWEDRKREAQEYEQAAKQATEAGDFSAAVKLADQARAAYAELNKEVKAGDTIIISQQQALTSSMEGVRRSGELAVEILKQQQQAAAAAADALDIESGFTLSEEFGRVSVEVEKVQEKTEAMEKTVVKLGGTWVDVWKNNRTAGEQVLDDLQRRIDRMDGQSITVMAEVVQARATGGLIQRLATGGSLPGYGGGDRIPALLEAGEFVIRKEAVRMFGSGIFSALNNLRLPEIPRFATGGAVGAAATGGGDTINLHVNYTGTGSGQDISRMADQLVREFNRRRRGRTA